MSTVKPAEDLEANPRVKAVFDDIRATRKSDFVNNMWRYLAFDPALLERTWAEVKELILGTWWRDQQLAKTGGEG